MEIKVMVTTGGTNLRDDIMRIFQKGNFPNMLLTNSYVLKKLNTRTCKILTLLHKMKINLVFFFCK